MKKIFFLPIGWGIIFSIILFYYMLYILLPFNWFFSFCFATGLLIFLPTFIIICCAIENFGFNSIGIYNKKETQLPPKVRIKQINKKGKILFYPQVLLKMDRLFLNSVIRYEYFYINSYNFLATGEGRMHIKARFKNEKKADKFLVEYLHTKTKRL